MSKWCNDAQLRGLIMTRVEGDIIAINNGELQIEIVEVKGRYVRLVFQGDREISVRLSKKSDQANLQKCK